MARYGETVSIWKETKGILKRCATAASFRAGNEVTMSQFLYDAMNNIANDDLLVFSSGKVSDRSFVTIYLKDGTLTMIQNKSEDFQLSQAKLVHTAILLKIERDGLTEMVQK